MFSNGFYHACSDTMAIGVRVSDEVESALQCRRCRTIPCTPMQDIWFQDVMNCEVCKSELYKVCLYIYLGQVFILLQQVQPHEDDSKTLKLVGE